MIFALVERLACRIINGLSNDMHIEVILNYYKLGVSAGNGKTKKRKYRYGIRLFGVTDKMGP